MGRGVIPGALIASAPGPLVLAAVATDTSGNSSSLTREIDVVDPADAHAPTTLISTPGDTTFTLKEITDVIGTVSDPDDDLHSWTLTLTPVGWVALSGWVWIRFFRVCHWLCQCLVFAGTIES